MSCEVLDAAAAAQGDVSGDRGSPEDDSHVSGETPSNQAGATVLGTAEHTAFTATQLTAARKEAVFEYDTNRYPFRSLMRRLCNLEEDGVELAMLHSLAPGLPERAPLAMAMMHGFKVAGYKLPKGWNKALRYKKDRLKRFLDSRAFKNFQETYHNFINEVVVPLIGDSSGVVFQDPPTFRVQVPSDRAIGVPHKDADYDCHVNEELNIWLPLTKVWGPNTLHVESSPGMGDFHPLELDYGQFVRFWGNQCHHYTVPNTSDATRVSFDFRLIPKSLYTNPFKNHIGDYPVAVSKGMEASDAGLKAGMQQLALGDATCDSGPAAPLPATSGQDRTLGDTENES